METVFDLNHLRENIAGWKKAGLRTAFVPTMGNLHRGHLSLLDRAREMADRTVMSIFVNPIQFGKGEDYLEYPSTLDQDKKVLEENRLDLLFAPNLEQLYPGGMDTDTRVTVPELSTILCGEFRPGHFSGVATVVTKLLINVQPDVALFGEKDYQQLLVIRRVVEDLCIPVEIVGMPVIREADGLALSSRNAYLSPEQRQLAPLIYKTLTEAADNLRKNPDRLRDIEEAGRRTLQEAGFRPEYFRIRRAADLKEPQPQDKSLTILIAAWLGSARLIDNIKVDLE